MAGHEHTVRGKMVRVGDAEANVRTDGSVHIDASESTEPLLLTEQEALDLYQVLADVIKWEHDE